MHKRNIALALVVVCLAAAPAWAGDKLRIERVDAKTVSTDVRVFLNYLDDEGRPITGRGKESFKLVIDSVERGLAFEVKTFAELQQEAMAKAGDPKATIKPTPVNVVIVVEQSSAMAEVLEKIKSGVRAVTGALDAKTKSKVAIIGFASEVKRLAELGNPADADSAVGNIVAEEGAELNLINAVRGGIDLLAPLPETERKILLVVSQGIDASGDARAFNNTAKRAVDGGVIIDTIGYAPFEKDKLRNLATLSGKANGVDRPCRTVNDIDEHFRNFVDELKSQYRVEFKKTGVVPGTEHDVQVIVESGGRSAWSNTVRAKWGPRVVPDGGGGGGRWWIWVLIGLGGLAVILLVVWLILRNRGEGDEEEEEEEPEEAPLAAPMPSQSAAMRTMALDAGTAGTPIIGWIVGMSGKHQHQTFKFKPGRTVIGTAADCDIVIEDGFMSGHHCEVRVVSGGYKLVDLGSTNGIVVNDKKVKEHDLVDNDVFRLGRTEFKFKSIS
jgi:hypothetical protein